MESNPTPNFLLKVSNLSKSYGGLKAVNNINLQIYPGEIFALVGDNGAGKSTLVKALAGALPPDSGSIEIEGNQVNLINQRDADEVGIGKTIEALYIWKELQARDNARKLLIVCPSHL